MEQNVLLGDVMPYILAWTMIITLILSVFVHRSWKFGKRHPEIFKPDTTAETKQERLQKAELRRQYNNQAMVFFSLVFAWMIGTIIIIFCSLNSASSTQGWYIITISVLAIIWLFMMMQRKPKE